MVHEPPTDPAAPPRRSLIGLDFGTTTSSALVVEATFHRDARTGRAEIREVGEPYRSEVVYTPLDGDRLDVPAIAALLDRWLAEASARAAEIAGGGAIITGLCARRRNAPALAALVRERIGDAVIATADDPRLESWLAFMGSAAAMSRAFPTEPILNLDIGGGTTNLALGVAGEVLRTGSLLLGARHVRVTPGTLRIEALSLQAEQLFTHLRIAARAGDTLSPSEVDAVIEAQVGLLEAAVTGDERAFDEDPGRALIDAPFRLPPSLPPPTLTFSGGVGELILARRRGDPPPGPTAYGDLGGELAARILASSVLTARLRLPVATGRATCFGLLRHATRLAGSTLHLPSPALLPLTDLPIVGRVTPGSSDDDLLAALTLAGGSDKGGCLAVSIPDRRPATVKALADRLSRALQAIAFPPSRPLVLLVAEDVGKALGGYVSRWGTAPLTLVVLDEIAPRGARFVQVGRMNQQLVPVSFYGMGRGDEE